jgi:hypothetical protein
MGTYPRWFFAALLGWILWVPAWAGTIDEETARIKDSYSQFFRDFPKSDPANLQTALIPRGSGFGQSARSPRLSGSYYNRVSRSAYAKNQVMRSLATLAQGLAQTAGSGQAFESSKTAAQQAAALAASSDSDFQNLGKLFAQESQQIAQNDRSGAENTASQIQDTPPPYVAPGYQPNQGENALVQAFNLAVGATLQALGGVLGGMAINKLLSALGIAGGQGLYNAASFTGQGLAGAAYNGTSAGAALNNGGAQVIETGAGAAQNQIYQIPSMQQPENASQGSALPGS